MTKTLKMFKYPFFAFFLFLSVAFHFYL